MSVQPWMRVAEWSARGELPEKWEQGEQTKHGQWWREEEAKRRKARQQKLQALGHQPNDLYGPGLWRYESKRQGCYPSAK